MENPLPAFHFFVEVQGAVETVLGLTTHDAALGLLGLLSAHDELPEEAQAADIQLLDAEGREIDDPFV